MKAKVGDEIVVDSVDLGGPTRRGQILEVRSSDGDEHYLVRWDDNGHETIFYPGSTSHVIHPGQSR
ncbi:MAG: DUF1918 domain-containing protein [Acidimicrobiia bacterium]